MQQYKTIKNNGFYEFCEKRSKFICYSFPAGSEHQAKEHIAQIETRHHDARHNVYAYVIKENGLCRRSDAGEPQGTAGDPVLSTIKSMEIMDALVVISRYFGGILLGAGGLKRAYSHGAKSALLAGNIITMTSCTEVTIQIPYSDYGKIENLISNSGGKINKAEYGDNININCYLKKENFDLAHKELVNLLKGAGSVKILGETYQNI